MKKIKELKINFIKSWAQPFADFLITRMKETTDENHFNSLYTIGLYLDFYSVTNAVYLN